MKRVGLCATFAIIILCLSAPMPFPIDETVILPTKVAEGRLTPLPYSLPLHFAEWVIYYCDETGVPVWIACRLFGQESVGNPMASAWNPRAVSWLGAQGLAQLMPINLGLFSIRYNGGRQVDPFDSETAIRTGLRYLADLYAITGSWKLAVMAYNGGSGHWSNPRKYGDWKPETIMYVSAILKQ